MPERWIIKLGGSLFGKSSLSAWLCAINEHGKGNVAIVPGGGPFADAVRLAQWQTGFDDAVAHRMALLAMEQSAWALAGMHPALVPAKTIADIEALFAGGYIPVWLPAEMALAAKDIPASWDMTSDSLAAWLAAEMGVVNLLLVKSCDAPQGQVDLEKMASQGKVDPLFPRFAGGGSVRTAILSSVDHERLKTILAPAALESPDGNIPLPS